MVGRGGSHPIFAQIYLRASRAMDRRGGLEHRERLLKNLTGRVIEVGAGNGRNFAHYPPTVTGVTAVEPEPRLRAAAREAAEGVPTPIVVVDGIADALPGADGDFDAVVASLVLCSVPNPDRALDEMYRVIRSGGQLRFYEHVAATEQQVLLKRAQKVADATVWPRLLAGCHTSRDTASAIARAGFVIDQIERFQFPPGLPHPAAPHILGRATRP